MAQVMDAIDRTIKRCFENVELHRSQMHHYQTELALPFLKANPFSALFVDMGLGKTVTCGTLIADLLSEFALGDGEKVLVVGPLRVMCDTWPTEFSKWNHLAPFNYTLIREDDNDPRIKAAARIDRANAAERAWNRDIYVSSGMGYAEIEEKLGPTEESKVRLQIRKELARSRTSVHFINREQLAWLCEFYKGRWPYRTVIIDESSSFKDHNSERWRALKKIKNTPGLINRLHLLTATPAAESYEHLWSQMYLLDEGKALGKNITRYRDRYFIEDRYTRKRKLRPDAEEEILDKIKHLCLVLKAKDYLPDVKEPNVIPHLINLDPSVMQLYETLSKEFVVTLPSGDVIEAETAAALSAKLQQLASGVLYETYMEGDWETEDLKKVRRVHRVHDHKIEALDELIEELQGKPLIVVYHFKSSLDRLKKQYSKAVVMDAAGNCVKDWNKGKIPILLVHPQSAGHGLNLQHGGHNMALFDIPWSLENFIQVMGRLARQGQKYPVMVKVLIAKGTIDELIFAALQAKENAQDQLFIILKRLIRKFRRSTELVHLSHQT